MIAGLLAIAAIQPAHAGAWTKEVGELYAKAGADVYSAFSFVAPGESQLEAEPGGYLGQQYSLYAEAGVLPGYKGQISVALPLVVGTHSTEVSDPLGTIPLRATTARTGDLRVAAQVALHPKLPISAAISVKIPTYANGKVGADYPTYAELFPKPGDGQVDLAGWVYGGFAPFKKGFAELGAGYVHRTESFVGWDTAIGFVDGVGFTGKIGRSFGRVLPILGVDAQLNVAKSQWSRQYVSVGASALIDVVHGVAVEPRLAVEPWAKNASQGIGGGLGVSVRR